MRDASAAGRDGVVELVEATRNQDAASNRLSPLATVRNWL